MSAQLGMQLQAQPCTDQQPWECTAAALKSRYVKAVVLQAQVTDSRTAMGMRFECTMCSGRWLPCQRSCAILLQAAAHGLLYRHRCAQGSTAAAGGSTCHWRQCQHSS